MNTKSFPLYPYTSKKFNVRTNSDLPIDQPWQGGKSQTAQGERSVTLGIRHQNYIAQDRHWRIWRSGTEWHIRQCDDLPEVIASTMNPVPAERLQRGGCHRAMLFNILPQGYAALHPGLSRRNEIKTELFDSCRPFRACFPANHDTFGCCVFSYVNSRLFKLERHKS